MIGEFNNVKIQGMASAVPEYVEENQMFESILGARRTKKQIRLTGVSKRHIAEPRQRASDLCYAAANRIINHLKWDKKDIKILIMVTQSPNYLIPSTAFFIQKRLGLEKDCVVFDINLGCSSFTSGVHVVSALLQNCNLHDKALLVIGDTSGAALSPESNMNQDLIADRMIFGSAGAAIALEKVEEHKIRFLDKADGNGFDAIISYDRGGNEMKGEKVFEFAINDVANDVQLFRNHFALDEQDIDYYIFHQAQKLILDNISATCDIPEEKELRSLGEYGNTSGTSVPVSVCANIDKFEGKENVNLFLCGFGIGLSWGIIYSEIPVANILPVFETSEHYDEDKKVKENLGGKTIAVMEADTLWGENMARYVSNSAANVILLGEDENKLREIQGDLFYPCEILCSTDGNKSYEMLTKYCIQNDVTLNGIVYPTIQQDVKKILEENVLKERASIVFLSDIEGLKNANDLSLYAKKKAELQSFLDELRELTSAQSIRVNAVLYDEDEMNVVQVTGNMQNWVKQFLESGCPNDMKRVLDVGNVAQFLLGDQSNYVTGSLISVGK